MAKPNNNYAAPHTPIASVKRPRASLGDRSMLSSSSPAGANTKDSSSLTSPTTPNNNTLAAPSTPHTIKEGLNEDRLDQLPMSPMHPARPLVIREDEPAVHGAHSHGSHVHGHGHDAAATADEADNNNNGGGGGSWVGRQVDALFSPVLNFLNGEEQQQQQQQHEQHEEHGIVDVAMDDTSTTAVETEVETPDMRKVATTTECDTQETESHETETASNDDDDDEDDEEEEQVQIEQLQLQKHNDHQDETQDDADDDDDDDDQQPIIEDDGSSQGSINNNHNNDDDDDDDDEDEFNPYVFIKSLPAYALVAPLRPPIALPPKRKDAPLISLVLDLDETLVHCTVEPVDDADLVFPVVFHGMTYQVHVRLRPHLFQFLEKIKGEYEVIVFTASQKVYANELLDLIDPDGKYIQHRMFRDSCLAVEGNFLKDLHVLGRDLRHTVLVDNSPHAFGYQVDNGIPIESWFDDPHDTELLKLERFLRTLHDNDDVRRLVRQKFQTHKLIADA
jgi:CTD small phosphatase-like protein 2